jgi:predicted metal-dependent phosphoesterase TrpH
MPANLIFFTNEILNYDRKIRNTLMNFNDLEQKLNDFNPEIRAEAVRKAAELIDSGQIQTAPESDAHNMHCHTFYSFNGYGFSPSYIAFIAKTQGWFAAGIVDFDVLDAVDEFLTACNAFRIRPLCGVETRAFIQELSDKVINSPGEPGIAYHMGIGFTKTVPDDKTALAFLKTMKERAAKRTETLVEKVNAYLSPVELDFEKDAVPLTPAGNVTERHVCAAYEKKAAQHFKDNAELAGYWSEKLEITKDEALNLLNDSVALQGKIRAKTMKSGGPGYVLPTPDSFPPLKEFNQFILQCGAVPAVAWLDGLSAGEQALDELLDLHISAGAAAFNIIPDRNWNIADIQLKEKKLAELEKVITACVKRDLPIVVGTEMNAPGQKLVDSFDAPELKKYTEIFKRGAAIMCAHTILAREGKGYLSPWASDTFKTVADKNSYFADYGFEMLKK